MVRIPLMAAFFGLMLSAATVGAESFAESISKCRMINNTEHRYQCYDEAEAAAEDFNLEVGDFSYETNSDPVTGQTLHSLSIRSYRGLNSRGQPIILELGCDSTRPGDYELRLRWNSFLDSRNPEVTTRLGEAASKTGVWDTDQSRETSVYPGEEAGYSKQALIETLVEQVEDGNENVVFRTRPYNAEPITAVFDFGGFLEVIQPMRDSCEF